MIGVRRGLCPTPLWYYAFMTDCLFDKVIFPVFDFVYSTRYDNPVTIVSFIFHFFCFLLQYTSHYLSISKLLSNTFWTWFHTFNFHSVSAKSLTLFTHYSFWVPCSFKWFHISTAGYLHSRANLFKSKTVKEGFNCAFFNQMKYNPKNISWLLSLLHLRVKTIW